MELREQLGALSAAKYRNSAVKTLDRFCQLIEAIGHEGATIDEKQRRAVIYRAMRSVAVPKFRDFVDLVQREDRLAQQKGSPPKSSSELISLFREEQRVLMKQGEYKVPGGDPKGEGGDDTKFISLTTNAGGGGTGINKGQGESSDQKDSQGGGRNEIPEWKTKKPSDPSKPVSRNGKLYYWCPHHRNGQGMLVRHKPEKHTFKKDRGGTGDASSNQQSNGGTTAAGAGSTSRQGGGRNPGNQTEPKLEIDHATLALLKDGDQAGFLARIQQDFC
jgi:hypothetical protein